MDRAEQRNLSDQASRMFKFSQNLRGIVPEDYFGVSRLQLSPDQISDLFEKGSLNLAEAKLSSPHGEIRRPTDLISLLQTVNQRIRDTSLRLGDDFLKDSLILAANIGLIKNLPQLPIICNADGIVYLRNSQNLNFKPGALVQESIGISCVASLNSTGIGEFVLVEQKTSAYYRIYHHNLARAE